MPPWPKSLRRRKKGWRRAIFLDAAAPRAAARSAGRPRLRGSVQKVALHRLGGNREGTLEGGHRAGARAAGTPAWGVVRGVARGRGAVIETPVEDEEGGAGIRRRATAEAVPAVDLQERGGRANRQAGRIAGHKVGAEEIRGDYILVGMQWRNSSTLSLPTSLSF